MNTWYVHIRIKKDDQFTEYQGGNILLEDEATASDAEQYVTRLVTDAMPEFESGQVERFLIQKLT